MSEVKQRLEYAIRRMEERDIPQTLEIDREAFPTQWPYPTYSSFKQELNNRLAHYIVAYKPPDDSGESAHYDISPAKNNKKIFNKLLDIKNLFGTPQNMNYSMLAREYIIGMAGFWMMVGEAHIITIGVRNIYRGQGIGSALLISMIDIATEMRANVVTLEVRVSNYKAQRLYKKFGFSPAGVRHKYYTDNNENALIMTTEDINEPHFRTRFQLLKEDHEEKSDNHMLLNNGGT